jgi:hypothetical protein
MAQLGEQIHFRTGQYRILYIEVEDGRGQVVNLYAGGAKRTTPTRVRFGEAFRLRVGYECLLPELPNVSCGVAAAFTRASDKEQVMYFNTNYPHSDKEMLRYQEAEFRKPILREGVIEGFIPTLQVRPDEYLLTVGILPNTQSHHEFYELHYVDYLIIVEGERDVRGAFEPTVKVTHEIINDEIDPALVSAGAAVLRGKVISTVDPEVLAREVYRAMSRSRTSD